MLCYKIFSSSSTSEEQINDTGTKVPVVAKPNADDMKGINENAFINHSTVTSHRNTNTNQIINDDKGSERKRVNSFFFFFLETDKKTF